jgi:hypothetical protein
LLLLARRAAPEFTLWGARPQFSEELRAAWMMGMQLLVSARVLLEARLERSRWLLVRLGVSAALQLWQQERQASWRALRLRRVQRQRA